jgi:hypothetical protein
MADQQSGRIEIKDLQAIASSLLGILDQGGIKQVSDLHGKLDVPIPLPAEERDFVLITLRPSQQGTKAYTVSYIKPNESGVPLEFKINQTFGYSQVIAKAQRLLAGYAPFEADPYENIIQAKKLRSAELSDVRTEIEALRDISTLEN